MMVSAPDSLKMCNDTMICLILEWLDATDLVAFDSANQSNRRMKSTWLRVIRSLLDIRPMRGLSYTHFWIRWFIDRGVRMSSMLIDQRAADHVTDATFDGIFCLPVMDIFCAND